MADHVIDDHQDRAHHRHRRSFFTASCGQASELSAQVIVLGPRDGMSGLDQQSFEMPVAFGCARSTITTGALVFTGG